MITTIPNMNWSPAVSRILAGFAALATLSVTACGGTVAEHGDGDMQKKAAAPLVDQQLLDNAAQQVIIPTYVALVARAGDLVTKIEALAAAPTPATLAAARESWVSARRPWEQNEAFLFGPVETQSYDAAIDSWPLNLSDLNAVLTTSASITPTLVESQPSTQRGFHALELLLYGENGSKAAADFNARELSYMQALAVNLKSIATALVSAWRDAIDDRPPYTQVLTLAGARDNRIYPSLTSAGEELVQGMIRILDEVADNKIAGPFGTRDPGKVESQFSLNSLRDFADNIRSVENLYLGCAQGSLPKAGAGFSDRIKELNPELDRQIRTQIDQAIEALGHIPEPFPAAIKDPQNDGLITDAQTKIHTLRATIATQLLTLVRA